MANTSVSLGPHWEQFIASKLAEGRYGSASELIRAGLRLLEEHEQKLDHLRELIREGEESGDAGPLNMAEIIAEAKADWSRRHG